MMVSYPPWQAIRTLHQVAYRNAPEEEIRWIIKNAFFMNDLLYGTQSVNEAQDTIRKATETLGKTQFPLTKWTPNRKEVLRHVNER